MRAQAKGDLTEAEYLEALEKCRRLAGKEGFDAIMDEQQLDALVAPTTTPAWPVDLVNGDQFRGSSAKSAALAGYPLVTVPAGADDGAAGRDHVHGARLERADLDQARVRLRASDEGAASTAVSRRDTVKDQTHACRDLSCVGEVDGLRVEEVAVPPPGPDDVLISVKATAVNYADALMTAGRYQTKPDLPFSPGLETAGIVAACGARVTKLKPGDRVMAILAYGGLAEMAVAPASETFAIPSRMSFEEAGAFPVAYISSHVAMRWQGRLEPGETVLVLGAAGGVGLTGGRDRQGDGRAGDRGGEHGREARGGARERGADDLVNYSTEKLTERVMALTDGKGADVCFDPVGGDLFDAALSALGWGGRILVVGFVGGVPADSRESAPGQEPRRRWEPHCATSDGTRRRSSARRSTSSCAGMKKAS